MFIYYRLRDTAYIENMLYNKHTEKHNTDFDHQTNLELHKT